MTTAYAINMRLTFDETYTPALLAPLGGGRGVGKKKAPLLVRSGAIIAYRCDSETGGADCVQTLVTLNRSLHIIGWEAGRRNVPITSLTGQRHAGRNGGDRDEADNENTYGGLRRGR